MINLIGDALSLIVLAMVCKIWHNRFLLSKEDRRRRDEAIRLRKEERVRLQEEAEERAKQRRIDWLKGNFDESHKPDFVDLDHLPLPPTRTGRAVQRFRVRFWTFKNEVCKPYSK